MHGILTANWKLARSNFAPLASGGILPCDHLLRRQIQVSHLLCQCLGMPYLVPVGTVEECYCLVNPIAINEFLENGSTGPI